MAMTMFGNHDFTPILLPFSCLSDVRDAACVVPEAVQKVVENVGIIEN